MKKLFIPLLLTVFFLGCTSTLPITNADQIKKIGVVLTKHSLDNDVSTRYFYFRTGELLPILQSSRQTKRETMTGLTPYVIYLIYNNGEVKTLNYSPQEGIIINDTGDRFIPSKKLAELVIQDQQNSSEDCVIYNGIPYVNSYGYGEEDPKTLIQVPNSNLFVPKDIKHPHAVYFKYFATEEGSPARNKNNLYSIYISAVDYGE